MRTDTFRKDLTIEFNEKLTATDVSIGVMWTAKHVDNPQDIDIHAILLLEEAEFSNADATVTFMPGGDLSPQLPKEFFHRMQEALYELHFEGVAPENRT